MKKKQLLAILAIFCPLIVLAGDKSPSVFLFDELPNITTGVGLGASGYTGILCLSFNKKSSILVSGDNNNNLIFWDFPSLNKLKVIKEDSEVHSVAWSNDGTRLASSSFDGITIWNTKSYEKLLLIPFKYPNSLSFNINDKMLAAGNAAGEVAIWDPISGKLIKQLKKVIDPLDTDRYSGETATFSPDGTKLFIANSKNNIMSYDIKNWNLIHSYDGHSKSIDAIAISHNGKLLASMSEDATIRIWDIDSGNVLKIIDYKTDSSFGVASSGIKFINDDKFIFAGNMGSPPLHQKGSIRVWDISGGSLPIYSYDNTFVELVWRFDLSPDGKYMVTGGGDGEMHLYNKHIE